MVETLAKLLPVAMEKNLSRTWRDATHLQQQGYCPEDPGPMLFQAQNLSCRHGICRPVFRNVAFELDGGDVPPCHRAEWQREIERLLRVLAGLLPAAQGTVNWGGNAIDWAGHRARLHYIGHHDALKAELTVAETLDYWRALRGGKEKIGVPEILRPRFAARPARARSFGGAEAAARARAAHNS